MRPDFTTTLDDCLELMTYGASIEFCVRRYPQQAKRLQPLLAAAVAACQLRVPAPSAEGRAAGEHALRAEVTRRRSRIERQQASPGWALPKPLVNVGAAAVLAVAALLISSAGTLPSAFDFGATSEAHEFTGSVTSVGEDSFEIEILGSGVRTLVTFSRETILALDDGSPIGAEGIALGNEVIIQGTAQGQGVIRAKKVHVKLPEFEGQVVSIEGSALTVETASSGALTVNLDASTKVKGKLKLGAVVKIKGNQHADGSITARKVEVAGGVGEDAGYDDDKSGDDGDKKKEGDEGPDGGS